MPACRVAVMGATGGSGTTTMATALAAWGGLGVRRLLALEGHGGGPHEALRIPLARGVDDLDAVRSEVAAQHVQQIAHQGPGDWDLVAGPGSAAAYTAWSGDLSTRLVDAMLAPDTWVADLGRGDHVLADAIAQRATLVVLMTPRCLLGAEAAQRLLERQTGRPVVVGALARPGEDQISLRALRRLMRGADVVEVAWDRRGVERLSSAPRGRRGLASSVRVIAEMVGADG